MTQKQLFELRREMYIEIEVAFKLSPDALLNRVKIRFPSVTGLENATREELLKIYIKDSLERVTTPYI